MAKEHQNAWVRRQLEAGKKLTSRDAVLKYGIQDLPKRISELRREGMEIESCTVYEKKANGMQTHWNVYWMAS